MAITEKRRQENRDRFVRVIYGGGGGYEGRKEAQGRLPKLQKAFSDLAKATNRDHYEFGREQGADLLRAVDAEVQKLRQIVEANAR